MPKAVKGNLPQESSALVAELDYRKSHRLGVVEWEELPPELQEGWIAATRNVVEAVQTRK